MTVIRICKCGGDVNVEYFQRPKSGIEWFLRCIKCGAMSKSVSKEKLVLKMSTKELKVKK